MPRAQRYFDGWSGHADMVGDFADRVWKDGEYVQETIPGMATDKEVLFALYDRSEPYSGSAFVLFERDGKLYEVHGSHCSCYGLEGQWEPEETTWEALAMRLNSKRWGVVSYALMDQAEAAARFHRLVRSHVKAVK
jgi:hypothetical protein